MYTFMGSLQKSLWWKLFWTRSTLHNEIQFWYVTELVKLLQMRNSYHL